jgi:para-aminobenzoate synthetase component 1
MRFNVAIRTITLFEGGEAVYNVGGGIVFDSSAEEEYAECLLKARFATGLEPASN